jgi:hypothetical protein
VHTTVVEPFERHLHDVLPREQRTQIGVDFVGAIGAEDHQRRIREKLFIEREEEAHRDFIRPLQIVDDEHQRPRGGECGERLRHVGEQTAAGDLRRDARCVAAPEVDQCFQ